MKPNLTGKLTLAATIALLGTTASAHDFWVNAFAFHDAEEQSTSVVTSIGWGHTPMPISEFMAGSRLSAYAIVAPDGTMMSLPYDVAANADVNMMPAGEAVAGLERIQGGDAFVRRVDFGAEAAEGLWRAHAANPAGVYSTWTAADGATVSGARFEDELAEGETLVSSAVSVRTSDAYWTVGAWQMPEPADVPLQLIPQGDLSVVAVGDEIVASVYRNGERVSATENAIFRAISETAEVEGTVDENGDLRITLPEAGFWILRSSHTEAVDAAGAEYAEFAGRISDITFTATMPVDVQP